MEIIKVQYKLSKPVKSYREIKKEAELLKRFIVRGALKGYYNKAFAICHCLVSETPMAFFVVSPDVMVEKMFVKNVIINPEIIEALDKARIDSGPGAEEGITIPNFIDFQEPCLLFPFRKPKKVTRYNKIKVKYQVRGLFGLKTIEADLGGIASEIFQHECEHIQGKNIYFESEEPVKWWELIGQPKSKGGTSLDDPEKLGLKRSKEKVV